VTEEEIDLENRELCPDGSCTGVLGADGRCKECGRSATGAPAPEAAGVTSALSGDEEALDEDRQLCPDGSCTGLIGSDGRCKECGTSATAELSS
jgi:hypothetical protein